MLAYICTTQCAMYLCRTIISRSRKISWPTNSPYIGPLADLDGMERLFRCKNRLSVFYCWMFSANSIVWSNIQLMVLNSKSTAVFAGDYCRDEIPMAMHQRVFVGSGNSMALLGRFDVTMLKPEVKYSRFRLPNRIYLYLSLYTRWLKRSNG